MVLLNGVMPQIRETDRNETVKESVRENVKAGPYSP